MGERYRDRERDFLEFFFSRDERLGRLEDLDDEELLSLLTFPLSLSFEGEDFLVESDFSSLFSFFENFSS